MRGKESLTERLSRGETDLRAWKYGGTGEYEATPRRKSLPGRETAANALLRAGYMTIEEVSAEDPDVLLEVDGFGKRSLDLIFGRSVDDTQSRLERIERKLDEILEILED